MTRRSTTSRRAPERGHRATSRKHRLPRSWTIFRPGNCSGVHTPCRACANPRPSIDTASGCRRDVWISVCPDSEELESWLPAQRYRSLSLRQLSIRMRTESWPMPNHPRRAAPPRSCRQVRPALSPSQLQAYFLARETLRRLKPTTTPCVPRGVSPGGAPPPAA